MNCGLQLLDTVSEDLDTRLALNPGSATAIDTTEIDGSHAGLTLQSTVLRTPRFISSL